MEKRKSQCCSRIILTSAVLLAALQLMIGTRLAFAGEWSEILAASGYPERQWIGIVEGSNSRLISAKARKLEDKLEITADLSDLAAHALVNSVVEMSGGEIVSSLLHEFGSDDLARESTRLARKRIEDLNSHIAQLQAEVSNLEEEIGKQLEELRRKAGLDDVSRIYAKIAELDRQGKLAEKALLDNQDVLDK
ncbi:MAG: hypothetical protein KDD42_01075 [Bdellovibrionales bacterium]|nr:hypothetical protein [Bdellovibrionales bacterium]